MVLGENTQVEEELTTKQVEEAIRAILYGGQSYQIGSRSLTRANLSELYDLRDKLKAEEEQEESPLHAGSSRRFKMDDETQHYRGSEEKGEEVMLILSRKIDQKIRIGDDIILTIIDVKSDQVKIGVEAPASVKVFRQEVFSAIQSENTAANNISVEQLNKLFK